ncbi:MerR family transcriptional regulator [candidate division KSB1 bacterium]|nr:MerR family transcriptional regulator [candidate division KSB1 bacterium]
MEEKAIKRLYYSISEVSRITGLKPYVLRYWETEFAELKPSKNRAGNRIYRKSDVRTVFLIKKLLYHDKFTIEGARQKLRAVRRQKGEQMNFLLTDVKNADLLREMQLMLHEILNLLDTDKPVPQSGKTKK